MQVQQPRFVAHWRAQHGRQSGHGRSHVFRTAIFRQINKDVPRVYHDAVKFRTARLFFLTDSAGTRSLGVR
jgi:hypothetical protein